MRQKEIEELIKASKKPALDFHGTVNSGKFEVPKSVIIITGTPEDLGKELEDFCKNFDIKAEIHYNDMGMSAEEMGQFKANKCAELGITDYFDNDPEHVYWIKKYNPELNVVYINRMNYVVFTQNYVGIPYAYRLSEEGNPVIMAVVDNEETDKTIIERQRMMADGMISKYPADKVMKMLKSITKEEKEDYFIDFDYNLGGEYGEMVEKMGFPGIFTRTAYREFEEDRQKAQDFVKDHYRMLQPPEEEKFETVDDAKEFMEDTDKIWVVKCLGDHVNVYVPSTEDVEEGKDDVFNHMDEYQSELEQEGFILQEKIIRPIEVTPETFYMKGKPIYSMADIEYKKRGAGDVGRQTGCSADLNFVVSHASRLCECANKDFDPFAKEMEMSNWFDASMLISEDRPYFGEFCSGRRGYNSFLTELSMLPSASCFFESVRDGKNPFDYGKKFGASITLFNEQRDENRYFKSDLQIKAEGKNVWVWDAHIKDGNMFTVGEDEPVAMVTGAGDTIEEAIENCKKNLCNANFPDMTYRDDLEAYDWWGIRNRYEYLKYNNWI